jgi:hypothetical protein
MLHVNRNPIGFNQCGLIEQKMDDYAKPEDFRYLSIVCVINYKRGDPAKKERNRNERGECR